MDVAVSGTEGETAGVALSWLGGRAPAAQAGVSWGVPWPPATMSPGTEMALVTAEGGRVPVQTWTMATWPDGSLKWSGHAAVLGPDAGDAVLTVADPPDDGGIRVTEDEATITVDTGPLRCVVARQGPELVRQLAADGRVRCCGVRPVAEAELRRPLPGGEERIRTRAPGSIGSAVVEQRGAQRCVIRAEGAHLLQEASGVRRWLPFVIRLYFYRGLRRVRLVHTLVIDHDPAAGFVSGVGVEASVPLTGPAWNRHVLLGGDDGFFAEPAQLAWTWRHKDADGLYQRQIAGSPVDLDPPEQAAVRELLRDQAAWRSFRLVQESADHYGIAKRTRDGCAWVSACHGHRSGGTAALSGESGGLAAAVADFWRKAPRSLEIDGLDGDTALLRCWLWSPDAEPMDLRHYDTEAHMQAAYEGFDEVRGDARGVANTNELWLEPLEPGAERETAAALAAVADAAPLLVCDPARYHDTGALGVWSLPEAGAGAGQARQWVEHQLGAVLDFYIAEIEQRRWYGFWDYGDVMHSYDPVRHCWRYDLGGFAWQNTELVPNLWLWYSFLRTGRDDVFRMAAAMARHTSEVDVYHRGQYAGLGSRHNVRHWGCSCKEARISMAGLHRPFLYLTADERVGEIMREVTADVEGALERLDPARTLVPKGSAVTHVRSGPDWAALCSNWMTEWERSGDPASLAAIRAGLASLGEAPLRLLSGPVFGYDRQTRRLEHIGDDNYSYHMILPFGGPETWMELCGLLQGTELSEMLRELGRFAAMTDAERDAASGGRVSRANWGASGFFPARLIAFAGLGTRAWEMLLSPGRGMSLPIEPRQVPAGEAHRDLAEIPWVSTNSVSQWSLNVIECLALAPDALDEVWRREIGDGATAGPAR